MSARDTLTDATYPDSEPTPGRSVTAVDDGRGVLAGVVEVTADG